MSTMPAPNSARVMLSRSSIALDDMTTMTKPATTPTLSRTAQPPADWPIAARPMRHATVRMSPICPRADLGKGRSVDRPFSVTTGSTLNRSIRPNMRNIPDTANTYVL